MKYFRFVRKSPKASEKAGKKPRVWDLGGTNKDLQNLERTTDKPDDAENNFTLDTEVNRKQSLMDHRKNSIFHTDHWPNERGN